jgi:hypothetical protein
MRSSEDRTTQAISRSQVLEALGWPSLAADLRNGLSPEEALRRLSEIGESESDATRALRGWAPEPPQTHGTP